MFRGISAVNLDNKGRLAVPKRFRDELVSEHNGQLVVTIDTEVNCLLLYPLTAWEEIESKLEALPNFNPVARRMQRLLIGHATDLEIDANGRVLLPPSLRDYAQLEKRTILMGQLGKIEIWDETNWTRHREDWLNQPSEGMVDLPDALKELSL